MVVKRQCSFCAQEIEPGTGTMFVKRDGTVFHFCSGSCRKQQLSLGRVGHRFKWTRAHALKKAAERSASDRAPPAPAAPARRAPRSERRPAPAATSASAPVATEVAAPTPAAAAPGAETPAEATAKPKKSRAARPTGARATKAAKPAPKSEP